MVDVVIQSGFHIQPRWVAETGSDLFQQIISLSELFESFILYLTV